MKMGFILGGAALVFATALPAAANQTASSGALVVAENDQHHHEDKGNQGNGQQGHPNNTGGHNNTQIIHNNNKLILGGSNPNSNNNNNNNNDHHHTNTMMMGTHNNMMGGQNGHGNGNRSFDRRSWQRNVTATRHFHFHGGGYVRPAGWYYRRWVFGEILPAVFWSQSYWIGDYEDYDLPPPPPGYVWVRYGDDALLVSQYNGEVLQVEYGVFD